MVPGLVISLLAGIVVLFGTVMIGIPVAVRLSRTHVWRREQLAQMVREPALEFAPSFQPLDLGPDPVRWPSETPWPDTARKELPWPSQTWDDPHFGAHWRTHTDGQAADQAYERAQAARRAEAERRRQSEDQGRAHRAQETSQIQQRAREEMQRMQERARSVQEQARQQVGRQAQQVRQRGQQVARQTAEAAAQQARLAAENKVRGAVPAAGAALDNLPSNAELEALVTQVGLAGTVQEIMKRTGWDFKTAAQYLARARRGR